MQRLSQLTWTADQLVKLSQSLSNAYNPGAELTSAPAQRDEWTSEKLIHFSNSLSGGFGLGL